MAETQTLTRTSGDFEKPVQPHHSLDVDPAETSEWLESLAYVLESKGRDRVRYLLSVLEEKAHLAGVTLPFAQNTPYINTIPVSEQPTFPGHREIERRIKSLVRWNAMAMVVRANRESSGIGGHISSYASSATLVEIGMNHFFRGRGENHFDGDQVYFQGHASPGVYARAFMEGRLSEQNLINFRREMAEGGGLSSYPHPWLMPHFWEFPTVSMGLAPIMAIYQARFNEYLQDRGILDTMHRRVWAFLGDGECDEPETLGAIHLASREKLGNLKFVINCNLQRLDGPVRGNGKIIQELEAFFRGAGWNVIKVIWGSNWDPLLAKDSKGLLMQRMAEVVDGQYQKYTVMDGAYIREHFFGKYPELLELVKEYSDEELEKLQRGGHDPIKVFAAYKAAVECTDKPTVILAHTVKGYGMGEAGEGRNITHQQKKLNEDELREFRTRFSIPVSDKEVADIPFYRPPEDSPEMVYMRKRREELGGPIPTRPLDHPRTEMPSIDDYHEFLEGSKDRDVSTTMAFTRLLAKLCRDKNIGKYVVPIVPDESRTFGMEGMFRQIGIYAHGGQLYEPADSDQLMYYKEAQDGQILEEGITEAGAMSSFIAAGNSYSQHGINMIPFFIYYSMFGFQRIGDQIWLFADSRGKGFLCGGTAGRTTLNGEGLQHQDGHSLVHASTVPNCLAYDPTYAYEIAVIVQDGIRRMYQEMEDIFYYITLENDNYEHPEMPEGVEEGILKGIYRFRAPESGQPKVHLWGSGAIFPQALRAQEILAEKFKVPADVWSVTSYGQLRRDGVEVDRWNRLHPTAKEKTPYIVDLFGEGDTPIVAASDYMKVLPDGLSPWLPGRITALGTDGFGRSESREYLRKHFEVSGEAIAAAALSRLARQGKFDKRKIKKAFADLGIDPEAPNPATA